MCQLLPGMLQRLGIALAFCSQIVLVKCSVTFVSNHPLGEIAPVLERLPSSDGLTVGLRPMPVGGISWLRTFKVDIRLGHRPSQVPVELGRDALSAG